MTVAELIKKLEKMPQDYDVTYYANIGDKDIRFDITGILNVNDVDKTIELDFV
jgi:hypothetical protein